LPFTALRRSQSWPAFSPDATRVAFGWTGESGDITHIYVKGIDGGAALTLTDAQESDSSPSWSPDGRWIAFLRVLAPNDALGKVALFVIPASGGAARRIATLTGPTNYRPSWTPDGEGLVVMDSEPPDTAPSLFRVVLDTGEKHQITRAEGTGTGDWCPAFSPDGRRLAFLHNSGSRRLSPLYVVSVDASGLPTASAKNVETDASGFTDFDWSGDGRSLVASTPFGLVKVSTSGGPVEPLPFPDGIQPTCARRGTGLIYVEPFHDTDIFRIPGPGAPGAVTNLISSTRAEMGPQYSSDGKRIAFTSNRTGAEEVWVADSEGHNLQQITSFDGPSVGSPRWSPDGRWIAFDSTAGGRVGIYVVASDGGAARRITSLATSSVRPSWSRNGKWIYFGSDESSNWEIWKTTPQGSPPIQMTHAGGREPFEDSRGGFVYYAKSAPTKGIWRLPSGGGDETQITDVGTQGHWALGGTGIYYMSRPDALEFQDFTTMKRTAITTPGLHLGEGTANLMAASPDDRCILVTVLVRSESHLMLVRNFR
jgi:Tol biopolymer transport system component